MIIMVLLSLNGGTVSYSELMLLLLPGQFINFAIRNNKILVWEPEGKRPLGRPSLDGRIILKLILKE
jgi:hypothetical protein